MIGSQIHKKETLIMSEKGNTTINISLSLDGNDIVDTIKKHVLKDDAGLKPKSADNADIPIELTDHLNKVNYLAVDGDGEVRLFKHKPKLDKEYWGSVGSEVSGIGYLNDPIEDHSNQLYRVSFNLKKVED